MLSLHFERFGWVVEGANFLVEYLKSGSLEVPEGLEGWEALEAVDFWGVETPSPRDQLEDDFLKFDGDRCKRRHMRRHLGALLVAESVVEDITRSFFNEFGASLLMFYPRSFERDDEERTRSPRRGEDLRQAVHRPVVHGQDARSQLRPERPCLANTQRGDRAQAGVGWPCNRMVQEAPDLLTR